MSQRYFTYHFTEDSRFHCLPLHFNNVSQIISKPCFDNLGLIYVVVFCGGILRIFLFLWHPEGEGALGCNLTGRCPFFKNLHNPFGKKICISTPCFGIY